ncbi:hypothetical protein MKZ38_007250 [Zalerion maritima]|uniref:Uncharacterized protein n=1 Tax=Zalerion maritima TaxID=339359 RepID=A0AAD5RIM1_9PEZI|nr:hypothetical protein MKZ38_007250 [Zalerion maritima]
MVYIVLISIIGSIIAIGIVAVALRSVRGRHPNPKLIPTLYLKKKWTNWRVPSYSSRGAYQSARPDDSSYDPGAALTATTRTPTCRRNNDATSVARNQQAPVDRNTSIRSVMTLPAYKAEARENEQVLGREGERDGIDVVLEMRSAEEEEELRNAEMEQLYHIRQLRRQWNAQREERRVQRREARARGDVATLQRLRDEATAARDNNELDELRGMLEDIKSEREARASLVNYASVGVARHDGTRIRANSMESENVGLLDDAESIGHTSPALGDGGAAAGGRNRASSLMTWSTGGNGHRRTGSALSVDAEFPASGVSRSRANSAATRRNASPNMNSSRRASDAPAVDEVDLGDEMPPHSPPGYEDAGGVSDGSGANTPIGNENANPSEPPPGYISREPSLASARNNAGLGISMDDDRRNSRGVGGVPQLPSLRLARLPQIVVDPTPGPGR